MESPYPMRSDSLRASYWRKELLGLLLWIRSEGFGDDLDAGLVERALGVERPRGVHHIDQLVDEGLLCCAGHGRYGLTDAGHRYVARIVADELVDVTCPGIGERGLGGGTDRQRPGRCRSWSRERGRRHA